jgi:hypothetical protein
MPGDISCFERPTLWGSPPLRTYEHQPDAAVFVTEIDGLSVMAFAALTFEEATEFVEGPLLRSDLMVLQADGRPLWNGTVEIVVREALPAERDRWLASFDGGNRSGQQAPLLYLVLTVDPTAGLFHEDCSRLKKERRR